MLSKLATVMTGVLIAGAAEAGVRVGAHIHVRPVLVRPTAVVVRPAPMRVAPALRVWVGGPVVLGAGYGELDVEVEPDKASVYIDGKYAGRGDMTKILWVGTHSVRVVLADGREIRQSVFVQTGRLTRLTLEL